MLTIEQKAARAANLAKAREARKAREAARQAAAAQEMEIEEVFEAPAVATGGEYAASTEPEVASAPQPMTPFDHFLASLDAETRDLFTEDELRETFEAQQKKAREERRMLAKKALTDKALISARIVEGVVPAETADMIRWRERMSEIVPITIDLPEMGDIGLRVDQTIYLHGVTYHVTRAQAESMRSAMYQAQQNELLFEGKDRRHWLRRRARGSVDGHIGSF